MSFIADTNVVSETLKPSPDPKVISWLRHNRGVSITAITLAEIRACIECMNDGKRKKQLDTDMRSVFDDYEGTIYAFDRDAAYVYGKIISVRRSTGRPIGHEDAQIAAVCLVNECGIATRNVKDFELIPGLKIVNQFE